MLSFVAILRWFGRWVLGLLGGEWSVGFGMYPACSRVQSYNRTFVCAHRHDKVAIQAASDTQLDVLRKPKACSFHSVTWYVCREVRQVAAV